MDSFNISPISFKIVTLITRDRLPPPGPNAWSRDDLWVSRALTKRSVEMGTSVKFHSGEFLPYGKFIAVNGVQK